MITNISPRSSEQAVSAPMRSAPNFSVNPAMFGGAMSMVGNVAGSLFGSYLQKRLLDYQYSKYLSVLKQSGASPSSIVQALTGSGASSMPSVTPIGSTPDIGANMISASGVESTNKLQAMQVLESQLRQLYDPKLWKQQIAESVSRVLSNQANSRVQSETAKSLAAKRPYELLQFLYNFKHLAAMTRAGNASASNDEWLRSVRDAGFDPQSDIWSNIARLSSTNPKAASAVMNNLLDTVVELIKTVFNYGSSSVNGLNGAGSSWGKSPAYGIAKQSTEAMNKHINDAINGLVDAVLGR